MFGSYLFRVFSLKHTINWSYSVHKSFNILTASSVYISENLLSIKQHLDNYLINSNFHSHMTPHNNHIRMRYRRFNKSRDGINFYSIKFYNVQPNRVRELLHLRFKNCLKTYLILKTYYTFRDSSSDNNDCND